jgi:hypothetical protein
MIEPNNNSLQKSWIVDVQEDTEGYFIQFTDEMLAKTGWKIGDTLLWEPKAGNAWTLRKKP